MSWKATLPLAGGIVAAGLIVAAAMPSTQLGMDEYAPSGVPSYGGQCARFDSQGGSRISCAPTTDPDGRPFSHMRQQTAYYEGQAFGTDGPYVFNVGRGEFLLGDRAIPNDVLTN